jgi:hypothetical protein
VVVSVRNALAILAVATFYKTSERTKSENLDVDDENSDP